LISKPLIKLWAALLVLLLILWSGDRIYYQERIPPGVYFNQTYLGSLSFEKAEYMLDKKYRTLTSKQEINVNIPGFSNDISLNWEETGIHPDWGNTLEEVYREARPEWWELNLTRRLAGISPIEFPDLHPQIKEDKLADFFSFISSEVKQYPRNAYFRVEEDQVYQKVQQEGTCFKPSASRNNLVEKWASSFKNYKKTVELFPEVLKIGTWPAGITLHDLQEKDVNSLMARFKTEVKGDANRIHNISLAADSLDGETVSPGESFSFNRFIGETSREKGYRGAPVILKGEFVEGVGGGICQVSTTLYNVALKANLEIIERFPHSLMVGYVDPGRDAAVAYDYLDLKFKNTHSHHLLIKAKVDEHQLITSIYGQPLTGEVEIVARDAQEVPSPIEEVVDPDYPPDYRELIQEGSYGYRVTTWRKRYFNHGETDKEKLSQDYYRPVPRKYLVGE